MTLIMSWKDIQRLGEPETRDLLDVWEELVERHQLKVETKHDAWPRETCWVYYLPTCSCGDNHPRHARTSLEHRPDIQVRIDRDHLKHLIQELLSKGYEVSASAQATSSPAP